MYNGDGNTPTEGVEWLQELELALERPARVLSGNGRTLASIPDWTRPRGQAGHTTKPDGSSYSLDECRERGITIVTWGTLENVIRYHRIDVSESLIGPLAINNGYSRITDVIETPGLSDLLEHDGVVLGEIIPSAILLHFASWPWLSPDYLRLDEFLPEAIEKAFDPDFIASIDERRAVRNREEWLMYLDNAGEQGIGAIRTRIDDWTRILTTATTQVAQAKENLHEQKLILDAVMDSADRDTTRESRVEQWEKMHADQRIEKLDFTDGLVHLYTVPMNLIHPETQEETYLGKFKWTLNSVTGAVTASNLDNQRGGFDHPHINNGEICFGDMGDTIPRLVKRGQLYAAIEMIFVFLGSVNLRDDWGRRASYWFEAEDNAPIVA